MKNKNNFKCIGNGVNCNMCDERAFGRCPGFSIIMQQPIAPENNDTPSRVTTKKPEAQTYILGSGYDPFNTISAIGH